MSYYLLPIIEQDKSHELFPHFHVKKTADT